MRNVEMLRTFSLLCYLLTSLMFETTAAASLLTSAESEGQPQEHPAPSADGSNGEVLISNRTEGESADSPALSRPKGIDNLGRLEFNDILPDDKYQYDKMRPPKYKGEATQVFFHVTVMTLDSIDESSMTYAADIFFAQSWRDQRLRFNQKMNNQSGHYRLLPVHWLKDIWHPDSYFKNAKQVTFQEMTIPNHYVWLYNDNSLLYMVKLTLVLSCAMSFQYYPHDTQQCSMKIESLSHTTDDLMFLWDPNVPLEVDPIELPQLDLVSNTTGDCTHIYATGSFSCVEVVFTFKRRLGYYLFHTYIPTCLIVIMSWISFWIRPEAVPARVTLGVTSLLTLSTQHANSQKSLPPVSYIKAIDVFMNACTVFVFLSLLEYAIVNVIMGDLVDADESLSRRQGRGGGAGRRRASNRHRMRPINSLKSRDGNDSGVASCRGLGSAAAVEAEMVALDAGTLHNGVLISAALPPAAAFGNDLSQARRHRAILVDKASRVIFPLAFIILNTVYWLLFYNGPNSSITH